MNSSSALRMLEQTRVSPPPGSVAEVSLPLTFLDVCWIHFSPVERVFFYHLPQPLSYFIDSIIPNLKLSLSLALQHFYPLAGNLRLSPDSEDKIEIYYKDGDSVAFTVAESNADFADLAGNHARNSDKFSSLVPKLPSSNDSRPVLALQVTLFPNSGICIGIAIDHAACDGSSSTHFIKSWASSCSSSGPAPLHLPHPLFDRSVIPDPHGHGNRRPTSLSRGASSSSIDAQRNTVSASFTLNSKLVEDLKQKTPFHCSTFVITCAYVWVCLAKAKGYPVDTSAHFIIAMDCRGRLRPPVEPTYFGNCIRPCFVEVQVADLVKEGGVQAAAEAISRAIKRATDNVMLDAGKQREKALDAASSGRLLSVSGSPKFQVYDTDFGWGRPCKVEVTSIRSTGALAIAESRDEPGGVEFGLVLPREAMEVFSYNFNGGIELLGK